MQPTLSSFCRAAAQFNLLVRGAGSSIVVSWPNTGSYTLQQNSGVANSNGWATSGHSISSANGTNSITISALTGSQFFRLTQ